LGAVVDATFIRFDDRPSDSPFVERIWRCHSTATGPFQSMAEGNIELVFTRLPGQAMATLRGPVTRPTVIDCPADGAWLAIRFTPGTYLPRWPTAMLRDRGDLNFPMTSDGRFWLEGAAWELPSYENAEALVARLARAGVIARSDLVRAALGGDPQPLSRRSVQRHFLRATGVTHERFRQIERARYAADRLRDGVAILDVVHEAGYFDQAHLSRALRRVVGRTPASILRNEAQLSFLYKTRPLLGV
jgi:hypothetical protein